MSEFIKKIEGKEVLETILSNYSFVNKDVFLNKKGVFYDDRDIFIKKVGGKHYIFVPDPNLSYEDGSFGLAVSVEGKVNLYEDGLMDGGKTVLYGFGLKGRKIKVKPIKHQCRGMIYVVHSDGGHSYINSVTDVNMAINAISNYILHLNGGGFFNINEYLFDTYTEIIKSGFDVDNYKLKEAIVNEVYSSFNILKNLMIEADYKARGKDSIVPLMSIFDKFFEILSLSPEKITHDDVEFMFDIVGPEYSTFVLPSIVLHRSDLISRDLIYKSIDNKYRLVLFYLAGLRPSAFTRDMLDEIIRKDFTETIYNLVHNRQDLFTKEDLYYFIDKNYLYFVTNLCLSRSELIDADLFNTLFDVAVNEHFTKLRSFACSESEGIDSFLYSSMGKSLYTLLINNPILTSNKRVSQIYELFHSKYGSN